jgi:hypothetical protein
VVRRGVGAEGRKGEKWEAVVGAAMAPGAGDRGGDEAAANRTDRATGLGCEKNEKYLDKGPKDKSIMMV